MSLPENVLWTLNRLDAVQRARFNGSSHPPDPHHLEALEACGFITVRALRDGGWFVHVLPDGQEAAEDYRRGQAHAASLAQQKVAR